MLKLFMSHLTVKTIEQRYLFVFFFYCHLTLVSVELFLQQMLKVINVTL